MIHILFDFSQINVTGPLSVKFMVLFDYQYHYFFFIFDCTDYLYCQASAYFCQKPFNLQPDFWKWRSWKFRSLLNPRKISGSANPYFFSWSPPWKKGWLYTKNLKKKSRCQTWKKSRFAEPKIFLGFKQI